MDKHVAWTPKISPDLTERAAKIKVVLMDVDGTITDGSVTLLSQPDGSAIEIKTFDAHDGQGMTLGRTAGLRMGVITGRESAALRRRMKEMGVEFVYEKQPQKIPAYEEILKKAGVEEAEVAYLGDDLPDLTVMKRVGLAVAVGDAVDVDIDADARLAAGDAEHEVGALGADALDRAQHVVIAGQLAVVFVADAARDR